ncbi:MAG TPA: hypothetical protein VHW09_31245 [Bryobacteraceae bacterium]|jgi:hypothetical protein|nr:hypothetical protein [Bryobacteraceae bacterium]
MYDPEQSELLDRLKLIEHMMVEGRRTTERWGWMFLLWGAGPLLGMWWESRGPRPELAWPVVTLLCMVVNGVAVRARRRRGTARSTVGAAISAVWGSAGAAMLVLALAAAWSGMLDLRALYILFFALAAVAFTASSIILRWGPQFAAALVWWAATLAAFVLPTRQLSLVAAGALLLGSVTFGAWLTYREWKYADE